MTEHRPWLRRRLGVLAATVSLAAVSSAQAQGFTDALWQRSQRDLLPRLDAALENAPSNVATVWADPFDGLSGAITVFPAVMGSRPCRHFQATVSGATGSLIGNGIRCREAAGPWVTTDVPDTVATLDPVVRDLQRTLHRLAYYDGPMDGTMSPPFSAALASFASDEQVSGSSAMPALRDLAAAAITRIPPPGNCPDTGAVVCGTVP